MRQQRKEALKSICSVSILKQVTRVRSLLGTCKLTHKLRFKQEAEIIPSKQEVTICQHSLLYCTFCQHSLLYCNLSPKQKTCLYWNQ